jgi:predicted ferric reductase
VPGSLKNRVVGAVKLELHLKHPIALKPGQYAYLNSKDLQFRDRFQAHPFMIAWWDDTASSAGDLPVTGPTKATSLTFLIQPRNGFTARLCKEESLRRMSIDGPYGQDLRLERYDTVILVGRGIGIVGILSYVKQLLSWKAHGAKKPRVLTRKLDLYWQLEENCQEKWVGHYLKELQDMNDAVKHPNLVRSSMLISDSYLLDYYKSGVTSLINRIRSPL